MQNKKQLIYQFDAIIFNQRVVMIHLAQKRRENGLTTTHPTHTHIQQQQDSYDASE